MAYERLTAQDASFLHVEDEHQPMHVGSLAILDGAPFRDEHGRFKLEEARNIIDSRLFMAPRFRKKVMWVPLEQGRPVWVDDEGFDLSFHVRLTALPAPGTEAQLLALFSRLQGHQLDRGRPLWELWFVEGLADDKVALIQKTHHCLVDGISGVDVATVLLDLEAHPPRTEAPPWHPEPPPSGRQLLVQSLVERATEPAEIVRSARAALRGPSQAAERVVNMGKTVVATATTSVPQMPWNVAVSPQRRWVPARVPIARVKAIKDVATAAKLTPGRCSLNDVVLAACAGALRSFLLEREVDIDDLVLKAMVPVSMRTDDERGALGNRVSMVAAELPVCEADPLWRLRHVHDNMAELKASGVALGGDDFMRMTNYLPPTILSIASRLMVRAQAMNLTITNVPGPQFPLYCMGAEVLEAFPYVPVVDGMALTIAVLSYNGQLGFGVTGDRDVLPDLDHIASAIEEAFIELEDASGAKRPKPGGVRKATI
ncbi:MAG: WS/DGAT/MGAT family O-acyltransferase [Acidimicrobiales bacterium]